MFTFLSIFLVVVALAFLGISISQIIERRITLAGVCLSLFLLTLGVGTWFQTHRIVPTQHVGVTRNSITQELDGLYTSGIVTKPYFGRVYFFPSATNYERCEQYTPAIKGSYGVTVDVCFYYDTGNVNWVEEINKTGSLDANLIMTIWRNNIIDNVARAVKEYTPEQLNENRSQVELDIFEYVEPWFRERNISVRRVSFKNWDFTSPEVAKTFDASIVSQRKITEQNALFEAAKISRNREKYEAETAKLVADWQKEALDELGFEGQHAIDYLWIKLMTEQNKIPNVVILGNSNVPLNIPVTVPMEPTEVITP